MSPLYSGAESRSLQLTLDMQDRPLRQDTKVEPLAVWHIIMISYAMLPLPGGPGGGTQACWGLSSLSRQMVQFYSCSHLGTYCNQLCRARPDPPHKTTSGRRRAPHLGLLLSPLSHQQMHCSPFLRLNLPTFGLAKH